MDFAARAAANADDVRGSQDFDAFAGQDLCEVGGNVDIFSGEKMRALLDDSDFAAEAAVRLGEFQSDKAAPENDEMPGDAVQFQGFDMRERICFAQACSPAGFA